MNLANPILSPGTLQKLMEKDEVFGDIYNLYGRPPDWRRTEGFRTLCRIILEQQVSLESAKAAFQKLESRVIEITPENVLGLTSEEMRSAGVSRQKNRYLKELARVILNGQLNLEELRQCPEEHIRQQLMSITGIGQWTTDIYLIFCLQYPDILPPGDIALISAIKDIKNAKDRQSALVISKNWIPYRSTASFFLWHYYLCKRGRSPVI